MGGARHENNAQAILSNSMSSREKLVAIIGAILLCAGLMGCSGSEESEGAHPLSGEALKRKIEALPYGISVDVAEKRVGKVAESHQVVKSPTFGRTDYLRYRQWQLNFVDGKFIAVWREKNSRLSVVRYKER